MCEIMPLMLFLYFVLLYQKDLTNERFHLQYLRKAEVSIQILKHTLRETANKIIANAKRLTEAGRPCNISKINHTIS